MSGLIGSFVIPTVTLTITIPLKFSLIKPTTGVINGTLGIILAIVFSAIPLITFVVFNKLCRIFILFNVRNTVYVIPFVRLLRNRPIEVLMYALVPYFTRANIMLTIYLGAGSGGLGSVTLPTFFSNVFNIARPTVCNIALPHVGVFIVTYVNTTTNSTINTVANLALCDCTNVNIVNLLKVVGPGNTAGFINVVLVMTITFNFDFIVT